MRADIDGAPAGLSRPQFKPVAFFLRPPYSAIMQSQIAKTETRTHGQ